MNIFDQKSRSGITRIWLLFQIPMLMVSLQKFSVGDENLKTVIFANLLVPTVIFTVGASRENAHFSRRNDKSIFVARREASRELEKRKAKKN